MIGERRENLCNFEGSFSFGGKFGVDNISFEISGLEPYSVSNNERGEFGLNLTFHSLSGKFMCCGGLVFCFGEFVESFFHSREVSFIGNVRKCLWFISYNEIEWEFSGGGVRSDVVDKFGHGYLFSLFRGI